MLTIFITLAVILLAYSNGANDNFKGTATLWGSGALDYKKALTLATVATASGSLASFFFAATLVKNFSGKGLVPDAVVGSPTFILAVALGAGLTVLAATRFGFPISTTHGLVGALVGAGYMAAAGAVDFSKLGKTFFTPLVLSPVLAVALSSLAYFVFQKARKVLNINKESCVCVVEDAAITSQHNLAISTTSTPKIVAATEGCDENYVGNIGGVNAQQAVNGLHYLSAASVCFARALNDTPKMAGLLAVATLFAPSVNILILAAAMALGGILQARKVAETMSHNITKLNHGQGFSANLTTSILVILASTQGLPVSTTHVSVGSLVGIGLVNGKADLSQIGKIVLSWLLTLPIAAGLAALAYSLVSQM
jgi:inorganic phosphate transporter, PiT family